MATWRTIAPGIRTRPHPTRRHGPRFDQYFAIRYTLGGQRRDESLGWASQGWTLRRAQETLGALLVAQSTGQGPATLAEQKAAVSARALAKRPATVADLWQRYCAECVIHNKPSTAAEKARWYTRRIAPAIGAVAVNDVTAELASATVNSPLRFDATGLVIGGRGESASVSPAAAPYVQPGARVGYARARSRQPPRIGPSPGSSDASRY